MAVVINDKYKIRVIMVRIQKRRTKFRSRYNSKKSDLVLPAQFQVVDYTTSPDNAIS